MVYGIAYGGAIPVFMAIVGEYFGRRNFASIRGWMQLCHIPRHGDWANLRRMGL